MFLNQLDPARQRFITKGLDYRNFTMLSPRFIPESVFYTQSAVRSPQSILYTDRVLNYGWAVISISEMELWAILACWENRSDRDSFLQNPVCNWSLFPDAPMFLSNKALLTDYSRY